MKRSATLRSASLLLVAALAVSACSGGDDDTDSAPATTAAEPADDAPAEEPAPESTADTTIPETTVPETTVATTPETVPETTPDDEIVFTDAFAPDSPWCVAAASVEEQSDVLDVVDFTDPAALEASFTELLPLLEDARDLAPEAIRADVDATYEAFTVLNDAFAEADYNILEADLTAIEDLDAGMTDASDRIEAYNEQVCGIAPDDDGGEDVSESEGDADGGDGSGFDPAAGTLREQMVAEFVAQGFTEEEANCIFEEFDFSDLDAEMTQTQIFEIFEACGIDLARLAELGAGG